MARTETALSRLCGDAGFEISELPPIITPDELAPLMRRTVAALANDRYRGIGVPYVKHGKQIRYLRSDVIKFLIAHREKTVGA